MSKEHYSCAVKGCIDTTSTRHHFPNPKKQPERFSKWLKVSGNAFIQTQDPQKVYSNHRVCQKHFTELDKMITTLVPSLHSTDEEGASSSSKRVHEGTVHNQQNPKKPCLDNTEINLFQDTLQVLDDTQTLIEKSVNDKYQITSTSIPQFPDSTNINPNDFSIISGIDSGGFTQICNDTQVMKKIERDIKKVQESHRQNVTDDIEIKLAKIKEHITPSGKVAFCKKLNKENLKENPKNDNTMTASQIKREVEMLFNKMESTICDFGDMLDDVTDENSNKNKNNYMDVVPGIKKDSTLTEAILDTSQNESNFSDIFRKALLENAGKAVSPSRIVNLTLVNTQPKFKDLGSFYGLPNKVRELLSTYRGINSLYDWQDECLNLPAIAERKNLVYALPTSGGKTLVAEILILRELLCRKKNAIFVLPYVAIVQEKVWALSPFAVALNFLVEEYAGGKGSYPPRKRRRKNSVYIATMEKALGLINSLIDTERLDEIGLIVVDELHLVGEQGRGSILEELLTKIVLLNGNIHIVGMSATIGNLSEITKFLNADVYTQDFRPVELTEYLKCENQIAKINWQAKCDEDMLIEMSMNDFSYTEKLKKIDPDRLGGLVMEVVPSDSCLVFCSSKKNCENVALLLCRVIPAKLKTHKGAEKEALKKNLKAETGDLCNILQTSVNYGIAYHHSGLTSGERKLIEDSFREGTLSVICCTSTLAAGVNLPARRVILRQPYIGREFINLSRYKQMVGRAGRAGLGTTGESFLICTKQDLPKVQNLLHSPMDEALSSMHENSGRGLRQLLLSAISLNIANTRAELHNIVKKTLLYVQQTKLQIRLNKLVDKALSELFKLGALEIDNCLSMNEENSVPTTDMSLRFHNTSESSSSLSETMLDESAKESQSNKKTKLTLYNNSKLTISKLGLAAIKGGLELTRAHLLYEDLLQAQASLVLLNCLHLLYLVAPYDISEQINFSKSMYYTFYSKLSNAELQTAKVIGITESCAVRLLNNQPIKSIPERVLKKFYVTLMLYDLWNEKSIFEVSQKYDVPRGLVQNLMTSAAAFSSNVVNFCSELKEFWCFAYLLKGMTERLQHCCIKELIPLMELPSVKQCRAKQLYDAGYRNLGAIAKATPNELVDSVEHMSQRLANQLIAAAKLLLLERVENLRDEAEDVLEGVHIPNITVA